MDGENNGKPIKMDDLGVPLFMETPRCVYYISFSKVGISYQALSHMPVDTNGDCRPELR